MYLEYLDALTYSAMLADHQVHVTPVGCLQNAVTRVVFKDGNFCFWVFIFLLYLVLASSAFFLG